MFVSAYFRKIQFGCILFLIIHFLSGCSTTTQKEQAHYAGWTHLELGAGNYGLEGHTKISQRKTVLKKLEYVSNAKNYIDDLPEVDPEKYDPYHQYAVLFWTLDELVKKKGKKGVFHVNDLYAEYAHYTVQELEKYAKHKGYEQVIIAELSGDYADIKPTQTLESYGIKKYDSVHLKNPEISFYSYGLDGDNVLSNEKSRKAGRDLLAKLANYSNEGLYFFPIDITDDFIPVKEKEEFINKGIFYLSTKEWEPVPYYFPEGNKFDKKLGKVYFIKKSDT